MHIRTGGPEDYESLLALGDEAVAWLVEQGRTGQWGTSPWTGSPKREALLRDRAAGDGLRIAEETTGEVLGAMVITGERQPYVSAVDEPELYVNLLITSRRHIGRGIGAALIDQARIEARESGIDLIRVDCYAGDDGKLVRFYTRVGFTPTESFTVGEWPGQLLEIRLSAETEVGIEAARK